MADITIGLGSLNNQMMNDFTNKINLNSFNQGVLDYRNINNLDDFFNESENSELLKGAVTKIQEGQKLEEADFAGLSNEDSQLVKDLQSLTGSSNQQKAYGPQEVTNKFSNLLDNYLNNVDSKHKQAEKAVTTFASGGDIDLHSVMIASEKAKLSMQLTMQMRNKIVEAYKEIQRIRV